MKEYVFAEKHEGACPPRRKVKEALEGEWGCIYGGGSEQTAAVGATSTRMG